MKTKSTIVILLIAFFIATNPAGAAAMAGWLGSGFVKLVDGIGTVAVTLSGDQ